MGRGASAKSKAAAKGKAGPKGKAQAKAAAKAQPSPSQPAAAPEPSKASTSEPEDMDPSGKAPKMRRLTRNTTDGQVDRIMANKLGAYDQVYLAAVSGKSSGQSAREYISDE
eukprot:15459782-Alexandrium_andersonii.AAC.1